MIDTRLYLESGYINLPFMLAQNCPFIVLIGPRGTGKTYTILDYYRKKGKYLLYMRRTQNAMDSCALPDLSPYNPICQNTGDQIMPKASKEGITFWRYHINEAKEEILDEKVAMGLAFSTFYNKRSLGGNIFDVVFFDEVIKEPLERGMKNEGKAFLNMCETVARNRELEGKKPVQFILAGNSDCLGSEILQSIGAVKAIQEMLANGKTIYVNQQKGLAVFLLNDSPISQKKKETSLYRVANNDEFMAMALNNTFNDLQATKDLMTAPLKELAALVRLNDRLTVYQHKGTGALYVLRKPSGSPDRLNLANKEDRQIWKRTYYKQILYRRLSRELFYEDFDVKVEFGAITGEQI